MKFLKNNILLILLILGGLNTGATGVFDMNVAERLLGHGSLLVTCFYGAVGISAAIFGAAHLLSFAQNN